MTATHVRFPPRWLNTLVPISPSSATATGMSLYTASNPVPVLLQNALWAVAVVGGARLLPGPRVAWQPPYDAATRALLEAAWTELVGGPIAGIAVYERLQAARPATVLLLCAGRRSLLVRVRQDPESFALEEHVSAVAQERGASLVRVPRLVGSGAEGGWHWRAYEAMSTRPHRPVRRLVAGLVEEVGALVEACVARPDGTPAGWRGMHGDLTPWNLRRAGGRTWLIDWEDCGWGPPNADAVYFEGVVSAMGGGQVRRVAEAPESASRRPPTGPRASPPASPRRSR